MILLLAPCSAGVAQLVEHHLAKVDVESSSLFARSIYTKAPVDQAVDRGLSFSDPDLVLTEKAESANKMPTVANGS